jgi:hypothetical protein
MFRYTAYSQANIDYIIATMKGEATKILMCIPAMGTKRNVD